MKDEELLMWLENIQRKIKLNSRSAIEEVDKLKKQIKEDSNNEFLKLKNNKEDDEK